MPNNIYRNSEGYYDPTAGAALAKCDRKEKSDRRKAIPNIGLLSISAADMPGISQTM